MQKTKMVRLLCAVMIPLTVSAPAFANTNTDEFVDIKLTPDVIPSQVPAGELRADAKEMAKLLEIESYVEQLREAKRAGAPMTRELMNKKMVCLWKIMTSGQEVRKLSGRIDRELAYTNVALQSLMGKKYGVTNALNTINFAQGSVLGINKQSFVLGHFFNTSQLFLITAASVGTTLAAVNLIHPYLWSRRVDGTPNVLAHFLDPTYQADDASVSYMWRFFTSPVPGSKFEGLNRRDIVIKHWKTFAGVDEKDQTKQRKLAANPAGREALRENIKDLYQRITLLHDLKSHVEEIDASLYELHKSITSG